MFSHVMVGVNDIEASKEFYNALFGTLGIAPGIVNNNRYFYRSKTGTFCITTPLNGESACHGNGSTIGFNVQSPEQADAFHAAGIAHGGTTCEEPPGFRDGSVGKLYLAYASRHARAGEFLFAHGRHRTAQTQQHRLAGG